MKRISTYFALILTVITVGFSTADAQSYAARSQKSVEQQVYKKLRGMLHNGVFDHITFQVNGSTVILDGKVNSLGAKSEAAAVVKRVEGVTRVVNNIDELPPSPYDDRIRREALRTFASHGLGGYFWEINPDVRIIVERGRITLEGFVHSTGDRNAMNIYANGITGVFEVTNNLRVGRDTRRS
jgi:hyperosmotically inducible periplasmic protein